MKRLLLTRPEDDSLGLRDALREMHIESVIAPMLRIENIPGSDIVTEGLQAFLITSANGARALATRTTKHDLPVYAVGDATARAASALGFGTVYSASGDVDDLARLVTDACDPADGALFHAAGTVTAGDLSGLLTTVGFEVQREKIYEARAVEKLPENAAKAIETQAVDGVVIYSPRTAKTFVQRVKEAALTRMLVHLQLIALSENVRDSAGNSWGKVTVAAEPTQESLLNAVRTCYY